MEDINQIVINEKNISLHKKYIFRILKIFCKQFSKNEKKNFSPPSQKKKHTLKT